MNIGHDNRNGQTALVVWTISVFFCFFPVAHSFIATTIYRVRLC